MAKYPTTWSEGGHTHHSHDKHSFLQDNTTLLRIHLLVAHEEPKIWNSFHSLRGAHLGTTYHSANFIFSWFGINMVCSLLDHCACPRSQSPTSLHQSNIKPIHIWRELSASETGDVSFEGFGEHLLHTWLIHLKPLIELPAGAVRIIGYCIMTIPVCHALWLAYGRKKQTDNAWDHALQQILMS